MTFQYPDDRTPSLHSRFARLSLSARLAIVLGAIYIVQLLVYLVVQHDISSGRPDPLTEFLCLRVAPLDWQVIYRVATYGLVHSTEPSHVVFNAIFLFFVGTILEGERGPQTMMITFWSGVVVGGISYLLIEIFVNNSNVGYLVGASAGVFAVGVAAAIANPNLTMFFGLPLWVIVGIYVGLDLVRFVLTLRTGTESRTAYVAHVGGALAGLAIGLRGVHDSPYGRSLFTRTLDRVRTSIARGRAKRIRERARRLDQILEKIHRSGMPALTAAERRFLNAASSEIQSEARSRGERFGRSGRHEGFDE